MSDEKRQTRLLPFRLRRDGAARVRPAEFSADERDVSTGGEEFAEDSELSALLRAWGAPQSSSGARERLLAEFRENNVRVPLWRRALSAELRVPLPVAACALIALLASVFALVARTQTPAQTATQSTPSDVRTSDAPAVKIVELPVERERVVTRYIYVERNAPRAESQRLTADEQSDKTRPSTKRSVTATRDALARSNSDGGDAARRRVTDSGAQSAAEPTSYFTRVDMADFQPAEKMELRIVKRGKTDEK